MASEKDNLMTKIHSIQLELKAPKEQYNKFGKYNYRSCEDILEAVKPLLKKHKVWLNIQDGLEETATGKTFIKAVVTVKDLESESDTFFQTQAYAQLDNDKKGMDAPQQTGTASSYARKYALNGLFLIDDTKDSDANEHKEEQQARQEKEAKKEEKPLTEKEAADFAAYLKGEGIDEAFILATYKVKDLIAIPRKQVEQMCDRKNLELLRSNYEKWAK